MKPIPLILDCDPGHDDALAMILAAHNPALNLLGITTVSGNGGIAKVTLNARRVATLANINVPIAEGAGKAILGAIEEASDIHGESALDGAELPEPKIELSGLHAVDLMAKLIKDHSEPVTLVATGPLTNIALFLKMYPQLKNRVAEIVFMGGSASRGNRTPYAEFNIWMDPEAADVVLRSGLPLTMCGLDVTHQALVTKEIFTALDLSLEPSGEYSVKYRVVSADGHPVEGEYQFTVASPEVISAPVVDEPEDEGIVRIIWVLLALSGVGILALLRLGK